MAELVVRGARVHYQGLGQKLGQGESPVVFLHGLVMDNLSSWYFTLANPLATRRGVLLYDLRGHGKSERTPGGYRVPELVADLAALLDALGHPEGPVDLVGNSFGGLLALAFAMAHPERAGRIVLVDAQLCDEEWVAGMGRTLGLEGAERDRQIAESFRHWLGRHSDRKRNRLATNARELVYADGLDLANEETAVPVGTTCRLCERMDCRQRAFPPIHHQLNVDENVRGLSFYYAPPAAGAWSV